MLIVSIILDYFHVFRVFGNSVLGSLIGPKAGEVTGVWRKPHSEEPRNLYPWLVIIGVVKSRKLVWAGHAVYARE
jgi:hypothetical protein